MSFRKKLFKNPGGGRHVLQRDLMEPAAREQLLRRLHDLVSLVVLRHGPVLLRGRP